jgi:hypothetical protein
MLASDGMNSPLEDPVVQECTHLILDVENDYKPVCMGYKRFFNLGEKTAATVDWKSAKVTEKIDGTLITMYWYKGNWHIASKDSPDASDEVTTMIDAGKLFYFSKRPCYNGTVVAILNVMYL